MKLLIIRFSALGDVAMTVPVVRQLAAARPDIDITVLSQPFCGVLFEGLAPNVHFLGADIKKEYHGFSGLGRLFRMLRARKFTHIADFHGVLRTHYLCLRFRMAGGCRVAQIDKERADRKLITAPEGKKQLKQLTTSFEKYRRVLAKLGIDIQLQTAPQPVLGRARSAACVGQGALHTGGTDAPLAVGIAPFAAHPGKIYPLEKMERVIELLIESRPDCQIHLFGGKGSEADTMMRWEERWKGNVIAESPRLKSMKKELELMARLRCVVSMDSANMHLASLAGTRVVSVWGATHPCAGFLGWQQSPADCVQTALPCRPCSIFGNKPCHRKDFACMNGITPESIVSKILA